MKPNSKTFDLPMTLHIIIESPKIPGPKTPTVGTPYPKAQASSPRLFAFPTVMRIIVIRFMGFKPNPKPQTMKTEKPKP